MQRFILTIALFQKKTWIKRPRFEYCIWCIAAGAVGVMTDCLEESVSYSKAREQHGSPLAKKQLIQEHLARIAVNIESSRWACLPRRIG